MKNIKTYKTELKEFKGSADPLMYSTLSHTNISRSITPPLQPIMTDRSCEQLLSTKT
jgi:hypothetical protein